MRTTARDLAHRDPAMAALLGIATLSAAGPDFGVDFGNDYGIDFGGDNPSPEELQKAWAATQGRNMDTHARARLLEPNKGSTVKIERYCFSINADIVLSTASDIDVNNNPDVNIRPQRVSVNAPASGFLTISELKVANVAVTVGGTVDGYTFNPNAVGSHLDLPTLTPSQRASVKGRYTGLLPAGYVAAAAFKVCVTLTGPATITA